MNTYAKAATEREKPQRPLQEAEESLLLPLGPA